MILNENMNPKIHLEYLHIPKSLDELLRPRIAPKFEAFWPTTNDTASYVLNILNVKAMYIQYAAHTAIVLSML